MASIDHLRFNAVLARRFLVQKREDMVVQVELFAAFLLSMAV
jgi:hypothetical protein